MLNKYNINNILFNFFIIAIATIIFYIIIKSINNSEKFFIILNI